MAPRARKRIHALQLQRAPDGSAFHRCEHCGVSVAIALFDMHECGTKRGGEKKIKAEGRQAFDFDEQPRSPFCFFMESFKKTCKSKNLIEIDQIGFNAWQNMLEKERYPYVVQAEKVNAAYLKILIEESNSISEVDDEADSSMVGKFDPEHKHTSTSIDISYWRKFKRSDCGYKNPLNYDGSLHWESFKNSDCFDSSNWDELDAWSDD